MPARRSTKSDQSLFDDPAPAAATPTEPASRSAGGSGRGPGGSGRGGPPGEDGPRVVSLHEAARTRYLNYALSVITSRALPDVRDGLKPVQRRILYTMGQQRLTFDAKHRKCAKVVGDVMGNYHPHGDSAIYDALVRMAQPFAMRAPLIDGSGNFGSLDGDPPAAMRYTECRLARLADQLLAEINQDTVAFRPNYDGTRTEPVVLPARLPNLLINGATGIAVGMATSIPPHNPAEVCNALLKLLDNPELKTHHLCRYIKGPDFPTGAQILNSPDELKEIYRTGSGSIRVRATHETGPTTRSTKTLYITSIPYTVNKAALVERIAEVVVARKLPPLIDVRDLSTDDVRIALELKKDADDAKVLAYLYKHTPLQTTFTVNLTCLLPTENPLVGRPERSDLRELLWHFLLFRMQVVTRRLEHELGTLKKRIHVLEGFVAVFDALDEIIKIIRRSDGKADAAKTIIARFKLDAEQTDAILELKLYRLAKLEILVIRNELDEKRKRAAEITRLLADEQGRWGIVRDELQQLHDRYAKPDRRRTALASDEGEPQYTAEDFIIAEDNVLILTRDGWVKRQKEVRDLSTTRLREGDAILAALPGSTAAPVVFFSNTGVAYTCRLADVPATTGHGEPIQKLFKLKDAERILAAAVLDERAIGTFTYKNPDAAEPPPTHALAATSDGYALRFSLAPFAEPSTRNGRRYARPAKDAHVVAVDLIRDNDPNLIAASHHARALICKASEVNFLAGPGKGVILIKLDKPDRLLGIKLSTGDRDLMTVETSRGATQTISTAKYERTTRGGKGRPILQRAKLTRVVPPEPSLGEPRA